MKKTNKLSALVLASVITAGTVSSLSAGALSYTTYGGKRTQEAFENALENCEYMVPVENELLGGCYILPLNTRFSDLYGIPGCFEIIKLEDVRSDYIQIWSAYDIDMEKLEEAVTLFYPDAVIQKYLLDYNAPEYPDLDVEREPDLHWGITIMGYEGSLPYHEAKEKNISYAVDIYPFYSSDATASLRAGNDIKAALIGTGVAASHGMERTHKHGMENTFNLILGYLNL